MATDNDSKISEPTALSALLEPLLLIFKTIFHLLSRIHWSWWTAHLTSLLSLPFKALAIPLKVLFGVLYVIFAPVIYVLAFVWSFISGVAEFVVSLEPLYTFFGVAAFIGILTGLILALSSTILTTNLNLQDSPRSSRKQFTARRTSKYRYLQDTSEHDSSSPETTDWNWVADTSPVRSKPARGLLSQTIHEEDGSSEDL